MTNEQEQIDSIIGNCDCTCPKAQECLNRAEKVFNFLLSQQRQKTIEDCRVGRGEEILEAIRLAKEEERERVIAEIKNLKEDDVENNPAYNFGYNSAIKDAIKSLQRENK
jgi:hypothetical protein